MDPAPAWALAIPKRDKRVHVRIVEFEKYWGSGLYGSVCDSSSGQLARSQVRSACSFLGKVGKGR